MLKQRHSKSPVKLNPGTKSPAGSWLRQRAGSAPLTANGSFLESQGTNIVLGKKTGIYVEMQFDTVEFGLVEIVTVRFSGG